MHDPNGLATGINTTSAAAAGKKRKKITVFVVNHRNDKYSSVEVFQYKTKKADVKVLKHLRTVKHRLFGR